MSIRKKYNYEDYHKEIEDIIYKKCATHENFFPEEDPWFLCTEEYFYKNSKNGTDGLHPICKRCSIKKSRKWVTDNPEQAKITKDRCNENPTENAKQYWKEKSVRQRESGYMTQWRRNNPDKVSYYCSQHRIHDVTKAEEKAMLEVFNYSCAYCGITLQEHKIKYGEKLHNDHVDDDGYNDLRNDVPACKGCNCSKNTENIETWYKRQEFFSENKFNNIIWWTTEGYKDYIEEKLPYRIIRKKNENQNTYHYELWAIDKKRNFDVCINISDNHKELEIIAKNIDWSEQRL